MKKYLSMILILIMLLTLVPFSAAPVSAAEWDLGASYDEIGTDGLIYTLNSSGDAYSVTGYNGNSESVVIPAAYNDLPVTEISQRAFESKKIVELKVGGNVTEIKREAFVLAETLEKVYIPKSVEIIAETAFNGCNKAVFAISNENQSYYCDNGFVIDYETKTLVFAPDNKPLPQGIKKIGEGVFTLSKNTKIVIPDGVTVIKANAFQFCTKLEEIVIPNSVKSIGSTAFSGCFVLKEINFPASVTYLGEGLFNNCFDLDSVTVSEGNEKYYSENDCVIEKNTKKMVLMANNGVIPSDVKKIGSFAIDSRNITELVIPESVISMDKWAVFSCSSLKTVTIPASVTTADAYAIMGCGKLTDVYCGFESKPSGWHKNWIIQCGNATLHWESPKISGDVNDSGAIDMMDYILLKRNYFGTFKFDDEQLKLGDVNKSGTIDMMDYILLKRAYFGTFTLE